MIKLCTLFEGSSSQIFFNVFLLTFYYKFLLRLKQNEGNLYSG